MSPHDLRHRFISLRIRSGWDPVTVARLVGHSKASITLYTFAHVMLDEPSWLIESLSRCAWVVPSGDTALDAFAEYAGTSIVDGGYRDRTGDLLLAKQALSQLSYGPISWWVWEESNFRPHPYQGCALTN